MASESGFKMRCQPSEMLKISGQMFIFMCLHHVQVTVARVPIEMHCVHADDKACMNAGVFALTSMCASLPDTISPPLIV